MVNIKRFESCMKEAEDLIKTGEVIGVPTDTVYGLVCDACNPGAVFRLYDLKKRPKEKPFQAVFPSVFSLKSFDLFLPSPLDKLAEGFLPGGLCPIARAGALCPLSTVKREEGSQAIRVPNHPLLLNLARLCGPLACSSANLSSQPTSKTAWEAAAAFEDDVPLYAFSDQEPRSVPSTVIRASDSERGGIEILREGEISSETIYRFLSI